MDVVSLDLLAELFNFCNIFLDLNQVVGVDDFTRSFADGVLEIDLTNVDENKCSNIEQPNPAKIL